MEKWMMTGGTPIEMDTCKFVGSGEMIWPDLTTGSSHIMKSLVLIDVWSPEIQGMNHGF